MEDFEAEQGKTSISKCVNCGADMVFSPKKGVLVCPFCDSESSIRVGKPKFKSYMADVSTGYVGEGKAGYYRRAKGKDQYASEGTRRVQETIW